MAVHSKGEALTPASEPTLPTEIPVLIVAGGPVGFCTSILCSRHGLRSLLVEQHPGTSIYPKARFINVRTMEIFRQLGIELALNRWRSPIRTTWCGRTGCVHGTGRHLPVE